MRADKASERMAPDAAATVYGRERSAGRTGRQDGVCLSWQRRNVSGLRARRRRRASNVHVQAEGRPHADGARTSIDNWTCIVNGQAVACWCCNGRYCCECLNSGVCPNAFDPCYCIGEYC